MPTTITERRPPLTVAQAAAYTGYSEGYLNKCRVTGNGPAFIKRNGTVRYDPIDLDEWLAAGKRRSTSEMVGASA